MFRSSSVDNINLEMLHQLSGIPRDPKLAIRPNKVRILEGLGFTKGSNEAVIRDFNLVDYANINELISYIETNIAQGRSVTVLIMRQKHSNIGGAPVIYFNKLDDIHAYFNLGENPSVVAQSGEHVNLFSGDVIKTFSREKGLEIDVNGLDNHDGTQVVNLAGGFRMQLDNILVDENGITFEWDASVCFDGYGPRVLTLSHENDYRVSRISTKIKFRYDGNLLTLVDFEKDAIIETVEPNDGRNIAQILLKMLLDEQGESIIRLLKMLLTIKPALRLHSLAGVYIVNGNTDVSTEIIDFDGIDSSDALKLDLSGKSDPTESLIRAKLAQVNFISQDVRILREYVYYLEDLKQELQKLADSQILTNEMLSIIREHLITEELPYSRTLSGEVQLGRTLKYLGLDWIPGDKDNISVYERGDHKFILIDLNGFYLAFWVNNGKLMKINNIRSIRNYLSESLGVELLDIHFSYLREGD